VYAVALLLYNLVLFLTSPFLLAYLLLRLARGKEDAAHWGERWGKLPAGAVPGEGTKPRFWVHAVSVGEVMAAVPILRELRRRYPNAWIVLSTTTPGGREVALKQVPPADLVVYYPLDFPGVVRRALDRVRPDVVLLMEWEIWPNFLTQAKRQGAKTAVLNGRISETGLRRGRHPLARVFTAPGLASVDLFAMQSDEDGRRAPLLGADPARVATFGNTKFDESATPLSTQERVRLRADLGIAPNAPVWICGSTRDAAPNDDRPDEEIQIAESVRRVWERIPGLCLIVAPRHLDRADAAARHLATAGRAVRRRSRAATPGAARPSERTVDPVAASAVDGAETEPDILLLDTFGELGRAYAVADVAFVGGSLVHQGGQSVFQPLAQGVPALFGPFTNNQRDITALALAEGVGFRVEDAAELADTVVRLASLPANEKIEISQRARAMIERNQGVAARCVDAVTRLLDDGT
jgi:3-deoxy-D-manno-octulosonic-acid transferase